MKKLYTCMRAIRAILMVPLFIVLASASCFAQTTLAQGDISIIGFNANSPDGFAFVTWVDLTSNTVIKFTDNGFNSTSSSNTAGNYREQEQYVIWTNSTGSTIPAGTVITIQANSATAPTASVTNIGTITSVTNSSNGSVATNMSLTNTSGDQVFAFQGAGGPSSNSTTFSGILLFGLDYSGSNGTATGWVTTGGINGSTSYLPSDLSGTSQIFLGPNIVAGQYTGPTTGQASLAAYKALVANPANWTTVGATGTVTFSTSTAITFSAGAAPSITGQPSNSSICAGANTTFSITASNAVSYQWQVNTGSGFVNLSNGAPYSGATSAALTITSATSALNTYQYQCVVTGSSAPNATSNAVTLTVKALPAATATPASATICSGSVTNIALTSTPTGASFAWTAVTASGTVNGTSASSGTSIAQTLSGNGTTNYTVTPTLNSCTGSPITVAVTVNPNPTATATPASATICSGSATNIALTSTPTGATFVWTAVTASGMVNGTSTGSGTSIAQTLSGNGTTNYTVTPTLNSCTGSPITVAVTVNPNPTATATPASATICSGSATNIALTSTPTGASFAWTAVTASGTVTGTSTGSGTSIAQTLSGNGTTNYTVMPTLNSCVGSPITVAVTVNPNPTATATPASATICSGSATNIALASTPTGATFAWTAVTASGTVNGTSTGSGTSIAQTLTGNGTTNYTITPTLNSCVGSPITVAVTVNPNPTATATPASATICSGTATNIALASTPTGATFAWTVVTASGTVTGTSASSGTSIAQTLSGNGVVNYTVTPTLNSCAGSPITVAVTVNPNPTATATPASATICSGSATNIALTSTPTGATFVWTAVTASGTVTGTSASSGTSIAQTLSGNGVVNYTVTPTLNNCTGSPITVAVTVISTLTATATPASPTICSGTVTDIALTSVPAGASFAWAESTTSGTVTGASAGSGTSIDQTLSGNGTVNYVVTPSLSGCPGSPITVAVTVNPKPTATATPASATICSGSATNIALTSTPAGASFAWTATTASGTVNGTSASSGTSIAQTLSGNGATNYTVTPTLNSCAGSAITVAVTVNPSTLIVSDPTAHTSCVGTTASFSATASNATAYQWQEDQGSGFVNISDGTLYSGTTTTTLAIAAADISMDNYTYRLVATGLCTPDAISADAALSVVSAPVITTQPVMSAICAGSDATFSVVVSNANSYQWQENQGAGFVTITDGSAYTGTTTDVLTIHAATEVMDGYSYQVVVTGMCIPNAISNEGVLATVDRDAPAISACPSDVTVTTGTCAAAANWTAPTATDNCSTATLTSDHASGDVFTTGNTVVTYTATDVAGNTSTCSFTVTVTDGENPVFDACPQDVTVTAGVYTYTTPTATDNCSGVIVTKTAGLGSGAIFPEGATVETYEATDASGNKTTCSFTITATAVSTATQAGKLTNISIYPNPASDVIYISSSLSSNETYTILVQDLTGKTIIQSSFNAADSNFKLELGSLSKGIYFLNIGNGNNRRVEKIIVE